MARYYLDTSIWKDYWEDRRDIRRPIGEFAFQLIKKILEEKHFLVFSDLSEEELLIFFSKTRIDELLIKFRELGLIIEVQTTLLQMNEAITLSKRKKVPRKDALHSILARDNNAIMVARDRHFEELTDIVEIRKPEEII